MSQQPVRVVVEKRPSGCGTWLAVMILLGLTIEYWYISLGIVAIVIAIGLVRAARKRELDRHRPGPQDPWLNEVAVALADLGMSERARNTGARLGGVPLEGDIGLQDNRFVVFVNLFAINELARQAEIGLRADPKIQNAIANGRTAVRTDGRVVYVANGRRHAVDDLRLDDVIQVVGPINVPPARHPIPTAPIPSANDAPTVAHFTAVPNDALEQLEKLAELHRTRVLSDAEFEAKKVELLRRI